ncbi:MAG TPA: DUF4384 domain-containing protein [Pyrinomonadaceae bacterium]|jgi:hypothetical protein
MRLKIFTPILAAALFVSTGALVRAQDQNEEETVRGSFLTTRVGVSASAGTGSASQLNSATGSSRPTRRNTGKSTKGTTGRNSAGASVSAKGTAGNKGASVKASGAASVNTGPAAKGYAPTAIGLGYTFYLRDASGNPVRVDPAREFHSGDRIRISLETNTDGYLYIFHTENNGEPEMLYPDARLDKGENFVEAHVPYEIPWNGETEDRRWLVFDNKPATERLYIVVARQPLPGVPTAAALIDFCDKNKGRCPWRPAAGMWTQVRVNAEAKAGVDKHAAYGQQQTEVERESRTRGLGLSPEAPEPSIVRMNASANAPILVTAIDLIHR